MILQEKICTRSVRLALAVFAGSAVFAGQAIAQEQPMQKVEITGSAIKRINVEGALPVQRLSQEAIARTGAATVADLVQALPAMQGFTIEAVAAGSNSGGRVSASIHGIGEEYTLVLLNGRRIAPQGSGAAINLNAIPMSAVERVEILTDGASALYGMVLALHGLSVATSGDYRRWFEHDGRRYAHTIDPRSAMPIPHGLASVTVVHPRCMAADAWSTALGVLGPAEGLRLAERHGLAARFLERGAGGYTEYLSGAMRAMLDDEDPQ